VGDVAGGRRRQTPAIGPRCQRFGFLTDDEGYPAPWADPPEDLADRRKVFKDSGWEPVVARDVLPGSFFAGDFVLDVHGLTVVGLSDARATSRAAFRLTPTFMYGSAFKGSGARWQDEAWTRNDLARTARIWKWNLSDIASIEVSRGHSMFKLRDEAIIIRGIQPPADAKGFSGGVSLAEFVKGVRPEDKTEARASWMRIGELRVDNVDLPASDGSAFLGFAEHMAKVVAAAQGVEARWEVETAGKDKSHVVRFG
jgi:hypothetical protein